VTDGLADPAGEGGCRSANHFWRANASLDAGAVS